MFLKVFQQNIHLSYLLNNNEGNKEPSDLKRPLLDRKSNMKFSHWIGLFASTVITMLVFTYVFISYKNRQRFLLV